MEGLFWVIVIILQLVALGVNHSRQREKREVLLALQKPFPAEAVPAEVPLSEEERMGVEILLSAQPRWAAAPDKQVPAEQTVAAVAGLLADWSTQNLIRLTVICQMQGHDEADTCGRACVSVLGGRLHTAAAPFSSETS